MRCYHLMFWRQTRHDDAVSGPPRRHLSPWWAMVRGMRAYGVAITLIWTMCACTVLAVFAVAVRGLWLHVGLAAGALVELGLSAVALRFLSRASVRGRYV
jgi:hypothetical protein